MTDADREVFDSRPIDLVEKSTANGRSTGFRFRARTVEVVGKPAFDQFVNAITLAQAAEECAPYWVGSLMLYAEGREDWKERLSQVLKITGWSKKTVQNYTSIVKRVPERLLYVAPSPQHADVVASLPEDKQEEYLELARDENLTVRELRQEVRTRQRKKVVAGKAKLEGMYRVIYADPPWKYRDDGPTVDGSLGKAARHYEGMTYDAIAALPVAAHALDDSVLFMWVTAPMLYDEVDTGRPGPLAVIRAWGFEPKGQFVWDKELGMPGGWMHVTHELLIVATRGSIRPDRPTPQPKSVIRERRGDEHSGKPESVRAMIMNLVDGPYLELFGREPVEGWDVFGDDARLWGEGEADGDSA